MRLDPESKLLIWKPELGPRPGDEVTDERNAPDDLLSAVVGTYLVRGLEKPFDIFLRDGSLYFQIPGEIAMRLIYRENGVFDGDIQHKALSAEFDLTTPPPHLIKVTMGARNFVADKMGR